MNKTELLKLIGDFAKAVTHSVHVVNGDKRGTIPAAARNELKAAQALIKAFPLDDYPTEAEITAALE